MNLGRTVFSQVVGFLPDREFRRCVNRYNGDSRHKEGGFSCWDQFLCMSFAQLTYREGLRDIEACLRSAPAKLYHMGIRGRVSRTTLADANEVISDQTVVLATDASREHYPGRCAELDITTRTSNAIWYS